MHNKNKMKKTDEYPLLKEGYDILECPNCDKKCYPDAKRANETIVYNMHKCKSKYQHEGTMQSFEININGDIVENNDF